MQDHQKQVAELLSGKGRHIPLFKVFMPQSVLDPLRSVLFSGYVGEGPRSAEFEKRLTCLLDNNNVLALNNGTAALHLALRLAGAGPGDEVITTPMTCAATNIPVAASGARIVWADIQPWTGNIDPEDVARKITPRTKAVLCVHWGGYPCDLNELRHITSSNGISLIEDACHALGASYHGRPLGSHSDYVCFSFQAIKMITTVDGGALACSRSADCERGRRLRWYGIDRTTRYLDDRCFEDADEFGYKFHMNDVTAAIGLEQLGYLEQNLERHRNNAAAYTEAFADLPAVRPLRYAADRRSSCWLYTLRVKDRKRFTLHMQERGVVVSPVHARNDAYSVFKDFRLPLPGVDEFSSEHIAIPVGWWLSDDNLQHIISAVNDFDTDSR